MKINCLRRTLALGFVGAGALLLIAKGNIDQGLSLLIGILGYGIGVAEKKVVG